MNHKSIEITVYGKTFKSVKQFVEHYGSNTSTFYQILKKYKCMHDGYRKAALMLIKRTLEINRKKDIEVYGMKFNSIKDCCRYFNVSDSSVYKKMKYNPDIERCLDGILGSNKDRVIKQSKRSLAINNFLYGEPIIKQIA